MAVRSTKSKAHARLMALPSAVRIRSGILEKGQANADAGSVGAAGGSVGTVFLGSEFGEEPSVPELAEIHEFGLGVPERSFIRAWFDARSGLVRDLMVAQFSVPGRTVQQAAGLVALAVKAMHQNWINEKTNLTPNAPRTIRRKSTRGLVADIPLVEHGVLLSNVDTAAEVIP